MFDRIRAVHTAEQNCDECGQMRKGVCFRLRGIGTTSDAFLCWEHFRATMQVMYDAGLIGPDDYELNRRARANRCHCCCTQERPDRPYNICQSLTTDSQTQTD
jgi:hypothetical protein